MMRIWLIIIVLAERRNPKSLLKSRIRNRRTSWLCDTGVKIFGWDS